MTSSASLNRGVRPTFIERFAELLLRGALSLDRAVPTVCLMPDRAMWVARCVQPAVKPVAFERR
ncbi:hypothetical protein [Streptomyces sp. SID3343]|uniref:hypothetical protein n=1 Tax=Streptomyces sp. SID3343 TaxID=2690260 RepID=UPI001F3B654A|nr:hypothetical protein [Streptomyces sp. SID3343]